MLMRLFTLFSLVALSLASAACSPGRTKTDQPDSVVTGMLVVQDRSTCLVPRDCGPEYSLLSKQFDRRVELVGNNLNTLFNASDDGLVFQVSGQHSPLSPSLLNRPGYENVESTIAVVNAEPKTRIPYHDFLVEQAALYTKQEFGCALKWNKTFSWDTQGDTTVLSVTMTNTQAQETQPEHRPYVRIRYDGNSGQRLGSTVNPASVVPCKK